MTQLALLLLPLALAIGMPALIAWRAPRRWRLPALLVWMLMPLIVAAGLVLSEARSAAGSAADVDKLVYALLLIGSFLALPWLIACATGYAVAAAVRRGRRPEPPTVGPRRPEPREPSAPIRPEVAPSIDPDAPTLSPPSGWRPAHVGSDHDDLILDGLPVWSLTWRKETDEPVKLPHPAHPAQRHAFAIYTVDDGTRATRFAAAELSNGVWGFYRWVVPVDAASGTSADGLLRYEHDLGPFENGRYDAVAPVARLQDARTGALLFDGAAWTTSRIVPQTDGGLLLALERSERQTIFRIDPDTATFRDLAASKGPRPLAELAGAAAAARTDCGDPANSCLGRRIAPDGSLLVELEAVEWGNTHWVRSPRVVEIATGRVLLDLFGTDYDAAVGFPRSRTLRLSVQRYHHGGGTIVEIDAAADRYTLFERSGTTSGPLPDLRRALDDATRRLAASAAPPPGVAETRPRRRTRPGARLLAGALALIAGATLITLRFGREPTPQQLDTIPAMPGGR